jgi:hypothetical protein
MHIYINKIVILFVLLQIIINQSYASTDDASIPDIFSAGESGGSIKFGIPWPKQTDSSNPITSLIYSIDGMQSVNIPLDGSESPADGSDPIVRKKKASKRLFQNFLRTSRERTLQRSSARENTITCPKDMNIAMGFSLQFSSLDDKATRECMIQNNKKCEKGETSCSTTNCAVMSNYEGTTNWDATSMRDAMYDTSITDFKLAQTDVVNLNLGQVDTLCENILFASNRDSHILTNAPKKYIGSLYLRGDYAKGASQTQSFLPKQNGRMYLGLTTPNSQSKAPSGFKPDTQDGKPIPKMTLKWSGSTSGTMD